MRIVVLGAGVIGVTSAWALARDGHEVVVLDRQHGPGRESSLANGGQISVGHAEPWANPSAPGRALRWLGREDAPLLVRWRADPAQWRWALRFLYECLPGRSERHTRDLVTLARYSQRQLTVLRESLALEYDREARGILHLCTERTALDALARRAGALSHLGVVREVKDAAQCVALEPALAHSAVGIVGGIYVPADESGDAHAFTAALAARAAERGVAFRYGALVQRIEVQADRATGVRLANGERVIADAYVVAAGCHSTALLAPMGIRLPVHPLKGYSVTIPLDAARAGRAPRVSLTDEAHRIVISRLGERLRAAGTAELAGYDAGVNAVRCNAILRRVEALFPGVADGAAVESWAGLRPATPNNVPCIGRTFARNVFLNTGHGTLGWTLACGSAAALADIMAGRVPRVAFPFR